MLRATDYFQSEKLLHNIFSIPVYKAQMESREKVPASVTYWCMSTNLEIRHCSHWAKYRTLPISKALILSNILCSQP